MSRVSTTNSIPLLQTQTGKFCYPAPKVMSGTYVTTPFTAAVTSITMDGTLPFATVVTTANHNLKTGDFAIISGASVAAFNSTFKVTVVDLVTFTIAMVYGTSNPSGTILFQPASASGTPLGCVAVGTGTQAGSEFQVGDWLYDPANNAVRQVTQIVDLTHWKFSANFPANVANATVQLSARGVYRGVSIQDTGAANGVIQEVTVTNTTPSISYWDEEGLDPICGDATGTTFTIELQAKSAQ